MRMTPRAVPRARPLRVPPFGCRARVVPHAGRGAQGGMREVGTCRDRAHGTARGDGLTPLPAGARCEQEATRRERAPFAPSHFLAKRTATGEAKGVQKRCLHAPPSPLTAPHAPPPPVSAYPPLRGGHARTGGVHDNPLHRDCANPHPHALPFAQAGAHRDGAPRSPARTPLRSCATPLVCAPTHPPHPPRLQCCTTPTSPPHAPTPLYLKAGMQEGHVPLRPRPLPMQNWMRGCAPPLNLE